VQNRLNTFKPKQALSFLDWNEALHIFMAIFLRKYHTEAEVFTLLTLTEGSEPIMLLISELIFSVTLTLAVEVDCC
jgi:hypothetical protein